MKFLLHPTLVLLSLGVSVTAGAAQSEVGSDLYQKQDIQVEQVPPQALEAVEKLAPGFVLHEAEKESKHGKQYLDLEGETADGEEIEFDMLLNDQGLWEAVEIQKDLQLGDTPAPVQDLFSNSFPSKHPARIIESQQMDGLVIYEFYFVEEGKTTKREIKLDGDKASVLEQEWTH
ncbi:PepSY-like domain-containing protein [Gilvimarinus sp. DA14]|uniref:PepSY-like domain-containing protein n=1 Tax=Gilvimarinus sp. DA14 TaxID=2956798 RepID=UPI0020B79F32|nr:PepSY-like domain-containing protein [Gilvimarinus sp. DA14]UTF61833.1 PepSY-like domain-containing protein [Gilvimarinus sp. DA14]